MKKLLIVAFVFIQIVMNAQTTSQSKSQDYVRRFLSVAKFIKVKYNIPVSITLGIGLIESKTGESILVKKANNHFNIKNFSKDLEYVTVNNVHYKKYDSAWESYKEQGLLIVLIYKRTYLFDFVDYVIWAKNLQKLGYSKDIHYAEKLIKIIEDNQLYKLDEL